MGGIMAWSRKKITEDERKLAQLIIEKRPDAKRPYDQIYMEPEYMIFQVKVMASEIANKKVVFMGDGDGMSLIFGLFAENGLCAGPDHMYILDFDKRILGNIDSFSKQHGFNSITTTYCYNAKNPINDDINIGADFFYTNPPYGGSSEPKGLPIIVFVDRCLSFCAPNSSGCIILPYSSTRSWTQDVVRNVQRHLVCETDCFVREMVTGMHSYNLDDDPSLRSATMIVDRINSTKTRYSTKEEIPVEHLKHFYGSHERLIPEYIDENGIEIFDNNKGKN
jgi:predicted methyltransferase